VLVASERKTKKIKDKKKKTENWKMIRNKIKEQKMKKEYNKIVPSWCGLDQF
jgi:hypothetical protein